MNQIACERLKKTYHDLIKSQDITDVWSINHAPVSCFEILFLGRLDIFGFRNDVSGTKRIGSAVVQTFFASVILILVADFLFQRDIFSDNESDVGGLAIISGIFAGCLLNERTNLYSKANYLSDVFNQISDYEKLSPRLIHKVAAYGFDCLILEMWAHKMFKEGFKEAIIWALIVKHEFNLSLVKLEIDQIQKSGLDYKYARKLLSDLIWKSSPI